ncbi:MAG: GNAT family N-acetyltransferase [Actinomycetes bacterium]
MTGKTVVLRPLAESDVPVLRAILTTPKVARWWDAEEDPAWPFEPGSTSHRFAVLENGSDEVIGMVQYWEETDPQYRHAGIDLFLDPRVHGQGLGTDAVRTVARHLLDDLGHHRVTIDPAVANASAVRCYEKVGFKRVGVMRRCERSPQSGTWRDGLLMDLLREDLT